MTAATLHRPAGTASGGGARAARRAVVRWAWRLFRREWRQQILVLLLLTAAVVATVLGAATAVNLPPPRGAGFGTADHLAILPPSPDKAADIAALRQRFGTVDVIENRSLTTGTAGGAQLRAQDPHGPYGQPMLALVSGRYPAAADEVAMTRDLASTYAVHVGDRWTGDGRAYRVVGLVENPQNLLDAFALVAPRQIGATGVSTALFDATAGQLNGFAIPGVHIQTPQTPGGLPPSVVVLLVAVVGLVFVGLVAVAGFATLAQRRLRSLGVLSSLGATDRHVRLVMVANGAVVGIVAAVAGALIGLAGWIAYVPSLQASTNHRFAWTAIPWWLVAATMVLAVVTATLAARRPARLATRLPIIAALSGRPTDPRPTHRSMIPGLVLLVAGLVLIAFSGGWRSSGSRDSLFKLGGLLATAFGVLLFAPAGITLLGRLAWHAPVGMRIALRDLGRYRARSGPALAAVSFAIFIAMLVGLLATGRYADPLDYFGPNLPVDQMVVYPPGTGPGAHGVPPPQDPAAEQATVGTISAGLGSPDVLPLATTDATLVEVTRLGLLSFPGTLYASTPELLRRYHIDPSTIDPTALLLTARPSLDTARDLQFRSTMSPDNPACRPATCVADPRIQETTKLPKDASGPNLIVTGYAMRRFHLTPTPAGWLIHTSRPLTATQINTARQVALAAGMTIETRSQAPALSQVRNDATGFGVLLALAVLAMSVGLIRSEATADLRTLAANGAAGRTRRAITASTAGALAVTGGLLGTTVAYLVTIALFRSELSQRLFPVPYLDIVIVLIGLPLLAVVASWLLAGREPPANPRQAIE
jgi:putative ABC transport system permease protein